MTKDIKNAFHQSRDTLVSDALGCAALIVILFVGLSLPAMI